MSLFNADPLPEVPDLEPGHPFAAPKKRVQIARVRYTHDAMIDEIVQNPAVSQNELAAVFGFSPTWVSIQINSDAFQERLAQRKAELIDPQLRATITDRLDGIARKSLDKIIERLDSPASIGMKIQDLVSIAKLGVGDKNTRPAGPQVQNNLYVVALPPAAKDSNLWLKNATGNNRGVLPLLEEVKPGLSPGSTGK